jgi:hypothetical protein
MARIVRALDELMAPESPTFGYASATVDIE